MRALHLDYQAPRPRSGLTWLLLCTAVLAAAFASWRFERLWQERAGWEARLALAQSSLPPRTPPGPDRAASRGLQPETEMASAVIRRIQFPWAEMFSAFEAAAGDDIALIGIEPDVHRGAVRLVAEARSGKAMLQYLRRLQRTPFLEQVLLQKHELRSEDPDRPLRFTVEARWKPRD